VVTSPVARQKNFSSFGRAGEFPTGSSPARFLSAAAKLARERAIDVAERGWVKGFGCSSAGKVVRHEQIFSRPPSAATTEA
jgi:hypothetical protein